MFHPVQMQADRFWPFYVDFSVELLQQEAVQLPLTLRLLLLQQRAFITELPAHSDKFNTDTQQFRDLADANVTVLLHCL